MARRDGHALVLGGGMGGLLAARALADSFDRVTVVERDRLPVEPANRRGVPQGRHVHALLPGGAHVLDELFPGLLDDLHRGGGVRLVDYARMHFLPDGVHRLSADMELEPVNQPSRPLLEAGVRARVRALPNVTVLDDCDVMGLTSTPSGDRVTGARVARHGAEPAVVAADLVVDATGRGSRTPLWLAELGYDRPAEDEVVVDVRYASRLVRLRPDAVPETLVVIGSTPDRPGGMGLFAYEDDTWLFTVAGYGDRCPEPDYDAMVDYTASFAPAHMVDALRAAQPLAEVSTFRFMANRRRRYDRMRRFPEGLLVFGDAMCCFNPIYGQGMSVAAMEALALRACLRRGRAKLARRFFRAAAKPIGVAWSLAVGADLAMPYVDGPRPLPVRLVNAYVARVLAAAEHDPVVAARFMRVSAFVDRPPRLMTPAMLARVALRDRRSARRAPSPELALP